MKTDVRLSTRFLTTQNAHQVGMLVTLDGETPVRRAPINVALVLDRSGSMTGMPLEAAKEAAARFAVFLSPDQDRLSVVTFDETRGHDLRPRARRHSGRARRRSPGSQPAARPTSPAAGSRGRKLVEQGTGRGHQPGRAPDRRPGQRRHRRARQAGRPRPARRRPAGSAPPASASAATSTRTCSSRWPAPAAATTGTSSPTTRWPASSRARSRAWSPSRRRTSRSRSGSPTRGSPA